MKFLMFNGFTGRVAIKIEDIQAILECDFMAQGHHIQAKIYCENSTGDDDYYASIDDFNTIIDSFTANT